MINKYSECGYLRNAIYNTKNNIAVFLDRDGTIIVDKVETRKIEDLEFVPDVLSLKRLQKLGFFLVIVTNQSGIGKGHYNIAEMMNFNKYMINQLKEVGIFIDALYYCPHVDDDNCLCKKPKNGMLLQAAIDLNIDLTKSYIIGDQNSDIKAGVVTKLRKCFLVPTGLYPNNKYGKYEKDPDIANDTFVVSTLAGAVNEIILDFAQN